MPKINRHVLAGARALRKQGQSWERCAKALKLSSSRASLRWALLVNVRVCVGVAVCVCGHSAAQSAVQSTQRSAEPRAA